MIFENEIGLNTIHVRKYSSINRKVRNFDVEPYNILKNELKEISNISVWNKLRIEQNFRTILIQDKDFILRETAALKNFKIITTNQKQQQIYNQLHKQAMICGKAIVKVIKCIQIQYRNGMVERGIIGLCPSKVDMDKQYSLLYVDVNHPFQKVYCYLKLECIRYVVRAVHACCFDVNFYQSLFGVNKNVENSCEANADSYAMKHNEKNGKYWIAPYVNAYVPFLYHWLLLKYPECINY